METVQTLFEDGVPMCIRHPEREQTRTTVVIQINITTKSPAQRKILHVQLTDNNDPFFYYSLGVTEEDFQGLKNEQSLKPDFATFPTKLIELLRQCIACARDPNPLYSAELSNQNTQWMMHIIKTDDFKNLVPLSLSLSAGNDATIKKYLAGKLSEFRATNAQLRAALDEAKGTLMTRANSAETQSVELARALESKTAEMAKMVAELKADANAAISHERERSFHAQQELSAKAEEERRAITQRHEAMVAQLTDTTRRLEQDNKDLLDTKYRSDADVKDLTTQLHAAKVDLAQYKQEITSLRTENKAVASSMHEQEKCLNQQKIKLSALEQQLLDKDELLKKMSALLDSANTQKANMEDTISLMKGNARDMEERIGGLRGEIKKGNQIIATLQTAYKSNKSKITQKEETIRQLKEEVAALEKQNVARHSDEARALSQKEFTQRELEQVKESEAALTRRLEECRLVISNNNNVIEFLQRELLKIKEGSLNHLEGGFPAPPPTSSYKFRPKYTPHVLAPSQPSISPVSSAQTTPISSSTQSNNHINSTHNTNNIPLNSTQATPSIQTTFLHSTTPVSTLTSATTPLSATNPLTDSTLTPATNIRSHSSSQSTPFSVVYNPPSQRRSFLKQQ